MATRDADVLLHPIRLRIVLAAVGHDVTAADLGRLLPDVSQATLYRHLATLAASGMLEVVQERRARGAIEKTYRVNTARARLDAADYDDLSLDDHLSAFTMFTGALIEAYGRYLRSPGARPSIDGVSFRQARLWLTDAELENLVAALRAAVGPYLEHEPGPDRRSRLLSTILMPEPDQPSR